MTGGPAAWWELGGKGFPIARTGVGGLPLTPTATPKAGAKSGGGATLGGILGEIKVREGCEGYQEPPGRSEDKGLSW